LVAVPMRAGDVLLHDGMLIHASRGTSAGSKWRRVLYPTFQSADKMAREGAYPGPPASRDWIAQHLKLMAHAATERAKAGYPEDPYPYEVPSNWRDEVEAAELILRSG
jgi:ectoine hydroxylase-related dioxygenase (phytanoyl-CoA dioxygenase family)